MENIEIELKFPLINPNNSDISKLKSSAQHIVQDEYQKDTYYIPAHRNFLEASPIYEWLRLRETKDAVSINYKNWHNKNKQKTVSCDEYETIVENGHALEKILQALNLKEIIVVEKIRNSWIYNKVEISVDEVTNLGIFIELEAKGQYESIDAAKTHLYNILKEFDIEVGQQTYKGYPYEILEQKGLL